MLQEIWRNSTSTAALYVCGILFLYILGLFLLLIHSIRQRTEQITCYDVYMELCDVGNFIQSIFRSTNNKQPAENKLRPKGSTRRQNPQCPDIVSDINEGKIFVFLLIQLLIQNYIGLMFMDHS